jgi:hypothetical protein
MNELQTGLLLMASARVFHMNAERIRAKGLRDEATAAELTWAVIDYLLSVATVAYATWLIASSFSPK